MNQEAPEEKRVEETPEGTSQEARPDQEGIRDPDREQQDPESAAAADEQDD